MSACEQFDQLHLFIDETGDLTDSTNERLRAVGGVLYFGDYDHSVDEFLRDILARNLRRAGGEFPQDLHFSQSALTREQRDDFLKSVGQELVRWGKDTPLYGVAMLHHEDIWGSAQHSAIAEGARDNRYQAMLWALIEALAFLDPKVGEKLTARWTLHLHVASRQAPFSGDAEDRAQLAARGFEFIQYKGAHFMVRPLEPRDLHNLFDLSLRQRWKKSSVSLGNLEVESIEYNPGARTSSAALYLADLYLGQLRAAELRKQPLNILHTYRRFEYGPWHEALVDMHLAAHAGPDHLQSFLAHQQRFSAHPPPEDSRYLALAARLEAKVQPEVAAHPHLLVAEIEAAAAEVDTPGNSARSARRAAAAFGLLQASGDVPLRAHLLYVQTQLSHANHTGDIHRADDIWQQFLALDTRLHELGADGLKLSAELRNRRAVSLTDHFRFDEARDTLMGLIDQQESLAETIAQFLGRRADDLPNPTLGALFGTLGQVEAFSAEYDAAESFFRAALDFFDAPRDRARQWTYLGHVACDTGDLKLWGEVTSGLTELGSLGSTVQSGDQYLLALILKAQLVFYDAADNATQLATWNERNILAGFSPEDLRHHPFGLINQSLGMLHEKVARAEASATPLRDSANYSHALTNYQQAANQMAHQGGALLTLLGLGARLRHALLSAAANPDHPTHQDAPRRAFLAFRNHIQANFGDPAWRELEGGQASGHFGRLDPGPTHDFAQRAQAVLGGIRFNYW